MNIQSQLDKMDAMVAEGAIVAAVQNFFAAHAQSSDYGNVQTSNKTEMIEKMEAFTAAIAQVNQIHFHKNFQNELQSASEFTFDFDMKDGSKIYWHEIILREWNAQGEVVRESYFNAA